jgi:hypothetical protein
VFQQLGYWLDKGIHKLFYGGDLRDIFLSECARNKVFDNEISYSIGQVVKNDIIEKLKNNDNLKNLKIWNDKNLTNHYIYDYLLDYLEDKGTTNKSDKMQVLTELARSLAVVSIIMFVISIVYFHICLYNRTHIGWSTACCYTFIILTFVFICLKSRYERYRIKTMIGLYFINM